MLPKPIRALLQACALAIATFAIVLFASSPVIGRSLASSAASVSEEIPTIIEIIDGETVKLPDWSKISLSVLGAVDEAGFIPDVIDGINVSAILGYDFGRVWEAGASLAEVLKFGDLESAWTVVDAGLGLYETLGGINLNELGTLTGALDAIGELPIPEVEFLKDLSLNDLAEVLPEDVIDDIAEGLEVAGEISAVADETLAVLGDGLTLSDVPALTEIALEEFPEVKDSFLEAIPFLDQIPFDKIAEIIEKIPTIVRFDALYGNPEGFTFDTISGGFNPPPCEPPKIPQQDCDGGNCPHVETFFPGNFFPGRWVSGKAQDVEGGCGPLKGVGGGKEPTGVHPFGNTFKYGIWDIDSVTDTLQTRIFFRVCVYPPFSKPTCTPYNIPPTGIPFIPFSRDNYSPA